MAPNQDLVHDPPSPVYKVPIQHDVLQYSLFCISVSIR